MELNGPGWQALAKIVAGYGGNSVSVKLLSSDKYITYQANDHTFEVIEDLIIVTSKTGVNVQYLDVRSIVAITLM